MNYRKLEQSSLLYQRLKALDAEIIALDKLAMNIATGETKINLSLTIEDLIAKAKEDKKNVLDADGSLIQPSDAPSGLRFTWHSFDNNKVQESPTHVSTHSEDIPDTVCLSILGLLIQAKSEARKGIVSAIKNLFNEEEP